MDDLTVMSKYKAFVEKLFDQEDEEKLDAAYEELADFLVELQEKYGPEKTNFCKMFHTAVGSSIDPFMIPLNKMFLDFEGKDSIIAFISGLAKKYLE